MTARRPVTITLPPEVAEELYATAQSFAHVEGYGVYCGPDPRTFTPDPDCSTPEERSRHAAACAEYAAAGKHTCEHGGFGPGSYSYDDPIWTEIARLLREAADAGEVPPRRGFSVVCDCDDADASRCGVSRSVDAFGEVPDEPCDCLCHAGAP